MFHYQFLSINCWSKTVQFETLSQCPKNQYIIGSCLFTSFRLLFILAMCMPRMISKHVHMIPFPAVISYFYILFYVICSVALKWSVVSIRNSQFQIFISIFEFKCLSFDVLVWQNGLGPSWKTLYILCSCLLLFMYSTVQLSGTTLV